MKYVTHYRLEGKIELSARRVFCIAIENSLLYRQMVESLRGLKEDCHFKLHDFDSIYDLLDKAIFIDDVLSPLPDDKKVNTYIEKDLALSITDEEKNRLVDISRQLSDLIRSITIDYPVSVDISEDISIQSLMKTFSVHPVVQTESFVETLILELRVLALLNKKYVFVLSNLFDYLDEDEYPKFALEMRRLEFPFFILSSHTPTYKVEDLTIIRVDKDLAELHIDSESGIE